MVIFMEKNTKVAILVIGSINMDTVIKVKNIPKIGETVMGEYEGLCTGGKGANQAYAAAKFADNVSFLGIVGGDENGKLLKENLKKSGCKTDKIETSANLPSGFAIIQVAENGNNSIIVVPGANNACDAQFVEKHRDLIEASDIIMLQLEIPMSGVQKVIEIAKASKKTILLNPAPAPKYLPEDVLTGVDYITPNESELEILSGLTVNDIESAKTACDKLHALGANTIIATLGELGSLYSVVNHKQHYPTRKVEVLDTTAAGDTFNGAFVAELAKGQGIDKAMKFANMAASITVTRKGAQISIPTRSEVDSLL